MFLLGFGIAWMAGLTPFHEKITPDTTSLELLFPFVVAGIGIGLGVAQWGVLRGKVRGAGWWIPITVAGWALAGLTGGVVFMTTLDALAIFLLPPAASTLALWLLLDVLPGAGSLAHAPRTSVPDSDRHRPA